MIAHAKALFLAFVLLAFSGAAQVTSIHWPHNGDRVVKTQYEFVPVEADSAIWDFSHAVETGRERAMLWVNIGDSILVKIEENSQHTYRMRGDTLLWSGHESALLGMRDYCGDVIYRDGQLERIMSEYGYWAGGQWHYHIRDYQGNVRAVIDHAGTLLETNSYYPYGGLQGGTAGVQPYKYGAKELDRQRGLDWYDSQARMYDPLIGRTPTQDPLLEKYYPISPYAWCAGNPVLLVDDTGKDGWVTIKDGQIIISSVVYLYGNGATDEVRDIYQRGVDDKWSKQSFLIYNENKRYSVAVHGKFLLYDGKEQSNPHIIPESWNPFNRDNFVEVIASEQRSNVLGGDEGTWRSKGRGGKTLSEDNPAPHEFGHLLGLKDRYSKLTNKPDAGWENNIMGSTITGEVDKRNILEILKDALLEYQKWLRSHNSVTELFQYEINP